MQTMLILLLLNNYLHDLATGFFFTSSVVLYQLYVRGKRSAVGIEETSPIYHSMSRLAGISLAWIIIGGIPRLAFFKWLEWPDAVGKGLVVALIIKHILLFSVVIIGVVLWLKLRGIYGKRKG